MATDMAEEVHLKCEKCGEPVELNADLPDLDELIKVCTCNVCGGSLVRDHERQVKVGYARQPWEPLSAKQLEKP